MFGALTLNVSFSAAMLLIALWIIARHEADLDWSKLMIVSALTILLSTVPPMFFWPSIIERFHPDMMTFWPVVLLVTLVWHIGIFVVMLNKFVWVPIPKALLAWVVIQVMVVAKDSVFAMIRGDSLGHTAWKSVTGLDVTPSQMNREGEISKETQALIDELKKPIQPAVVVPEMEAPAVETNAVVPAPEPAPAANDVFQAPEPAVAEPVAVQPAAPGTVAAPPEEVADPDREASRKLLVVNGKTTRGGRVIVLVNGHPVEAGDTVTVTYNGRRFTWRLASFKNGAPQWEKP